MGGRFVPVRSPLQASTEHTEVWLAEGADHTVLYDKHPVEYRARVLGLLARVCDQVTAAAAASQ